MHIPSERIREEMNGVDGAIWYVPTTNENETAILLKSTSHVLKSIIKGCKIELLFGKYKEDEKIYLCIGIKIYDTIESPLMLIQLQKQKEEHISLFKIINRLSSKMFLFNEMDISVSWTTLKIKKCDINTIEDFLNEKDEFYEGDYPNINEKILDSFQISLDDTCIIENRKKIPIISLSVDFDEWVSNNINFVGYHEHNNIMLNSLNEGDDFENAIWFSLDSVFKYNLHKSPNVKIGNKVRELTDILCHYEFGTFLIEAKNLSVIKSGYKRTQERKISGIKKQIKKAIKQLEGACRAITNEEEVTDIKNNTIVFKRDIPFHCIILVSEIIHTGDWTDIEKSLLSAFENTNSMFHILDFKEFITLLKGSNGKDMLVDYNLMMRFKLFMEKKSIHIRSV